MPWSATIEVMLPPRGAGDWSQAKIGSWRVGTVVAAYAHKGSLPAVGMPRTGYVHVTGIPDTIRPVRAREVLTRLWTDAGGNQVERRVWRVDPSAVPAAARDTLRINRQITVTWTQFKAAVTHLVELRPVADSDFD